jgi:hypothetical protein
VCHPSGWTQSEIFSSGFLISSNIQSRQNKILLSWYWTGTINTQGIWRLLFQLERIMVTSFASHLTATTKCNPWTKRSRGP